MATERKWYELILTEVRKPAGYGNLVHVIKRSRNERELWFQHDSDPTILRCAVVNLANGKAQKAKTVLTKGVRNRADND